MIATRTHYAKGLYSVAIYSSKFTRIVIYNGNGRL